MKKLKPITVKYLKMFVIAWFLVIIYEFFFINTKFGLSNFINENSLIYTIMITTPMIVIIAFLGAFVIASHYKEITDTWKKHPEKIIDELKLTAIGILFFIIICIVYAIFNLRL